MISPSFIDRMMARNRASDSRSSVSTRLRKIIEPSCFATVASTSAARWSRRPAAGRKKQSTAVTWWPLMTGIATPIWNPAATAAS